MRFSRSRLLPSGLEDTGLPSRRYRSRQLKPFLPSRCSLWAIRQIPTMRTAPHEESARRVSQEPIDVIRRCRQEFSETDCAGEENWSCILISTLGEHSRLCRPDGWHQLRRIGLNELLRFVRVEMTS